tara:strand:- start:311 stop:493 length:183 start_codon:yes stop_codon:yes gene_type:complete
MKVGDLVTHEDYRERIGIVVGLDTGFDTVAVHWLGGGDGFIQQSLHSKHLLIKLETSETL